MRYACVTGTVLLFAVLGACRAAPVEPKLVPVGSRIAVFAGVDRFTDDAIKRDLGGCANDAVELQEVLRQRFRFMPVAVLTNQDATKEAIKKALAKARDKARPGDQVLFFFSGYGGLGMTDGVEKPTLCPYDALAANAGHDVWLGDLYTWASEVRSKGASPIIILDCCFMEPALKAMGPRIRPKCLSRTETVSRQAADSVDQALRNVALAGGAALITACEPGEVAQEWDRSVDEWIGVFTYNMIQELNKLSYDDNLSFLRLQDRLARRTNRFVADRYYGGSYTQTPKVYGVPEYLSQAGLNSQAQAIAQAQASSVLRLLIECRGFKSEEQQALKQEFGRMPHIELVEDEERAHLQLHVFQKENGELDAYLLDYTEAEFSQKNSAGDTVVPAAFTGSRGDSTGFLHEINARVRTLVAYQWLGSLAVGDPSLGLELKLTDRAGKPLNSVSADMCDRGEVLVSLKTARECYVTLYAVTPRGEYVRILPDDPQMDSQPFSAGESWSDHLYVNSPQRWRLLAIARGEQDHQSDKILRQLWKSSLQGAYGVAPELISLGPDGSAQGNTGTTATGQPRILPMGSVDLLGLSAMGEGPKDEEDAAEMLEDVATEVVDLVVTEAGSE